jgi:hypothetical protein
MTACLSLRNESEPYIRLGHYLELKRVGLVLLVALVVIGLIGAMYLGSTPWGQAFFENLKHFLTTEMNMRHVIYIILGSLGICILPYVVLCIIRRIDMCYGRPVNLDNPYQTSADVNLTDLKENWDESPTEISEYEASDDSLRRLYSVLNPDDSDDVTL